MPSSRIVASPSTTGGITESTVIAPNSTTHSHVMPVVIVRKLSPRAVASSTESTA